MINKQAKVLTYVKNMKRWEVKKMNKGWISFVLVLVIIVSSIQPISVYAADTPTIELKSNNTQPEVGDVFTYDILMKGITNFCALQVTLFYDPDVLKLVDASGNITEDPALFTIKKNLLGEFAYAGVQADNTNGLVDCTLFVSTGQADYVIQSGPGQIDENGFFIGGLRFKAIAPGNTSVQVAVSGAVDASGDPIPWNEANADGYIYIDTLDNAFEGISTNCQIPAMSNVIVDSAGARLDSIASKVDHSPAGGDGLTKDSAITWEINVDYTKSELTPNDIEINGNATKTLYSDSGFTSEITGGSSLLLTAGGATVAYVKVTDQDTSIAKYYAVTINRADAPAQDTIAPTLSAVSASAVVDTTATLNFTSSEAGTYYYLVYAAADAKPDAATIKAQGTAVAKGTNVAMPAANTANVTGLTASTNYIAYVIVEDAYQNVSAVSEISFKTAAEEPEQAVNSVTVEPSTVSVTLGTTQQLIATVDAEGGAPETVIWISDDGTGKVTVNETTGLVTVAADAIPGDYTITATSTFDGTKSDTSTITVTSEAVTPSVNSVSVNPETASVKQGGIQQLTATVVVEGGAELTVSWTSSSAGAVTVDENGLVIVAVDAAVGNYTITATSTVDGTKSDTSIITVTTEAQEPDPEAEQVVNGVTVEPSTVSVTLGTTQQLIATVDAVGGAAETVSWSSSDGTGKVTVNAAGLVTVAADAIPGDYTVTATSTFDLDVSGAAIITVTSEAVTPSVNSVNVTPATASVTQGGIQQLAATVVVVGGAEQTVSWTSSSAGAVTVDENGLVTVAVDAAVGNYTITATSTVDGSKSDTSIITVTEAPVIDSIAPMAILTAPEVGTRTQLIVSFDEALNTSTLAIDNIADLLSAATSDADGTGTIALAGGEGTVTWDTSDVNAPKAIIKILPTAFVLDKTVRLNFLDGVVRDLQNNAITQITNVEATVIADTTPPKATITAPIKGANVQLEITFDEELSSTSVTNIANLLSSITYDVNGANVPISVASVASSVVWDKTDPYAPKATIKIPFTLFELDKKVRLNFKLNAVKDKAGNAIDPVQNFEVVVVDNEITSDVYIIDNQKMIIRGLDATWKTNSATSVVNFKNNIVTNGGSLTLIKRDGSGNYTSTNIGSGVKVSLSGSSKVYTVMLYGDINGDGSINALDLSTLKTHLQSSTKVTDENLLKAANTSRDAGGAINAADLSVLKTHLSTSTKVNQK